MLAERTVRTDKVGCLWCEWCVDSDEITLSPDILKISLLNVHLSEASCSHHGIIADDMHAHSLGT